MTMALQAMDRVVKPCLEQRGLPVRRNCGVTNVCRDFSPLSSAQRPLSLAFGRLSKAGRCWPRISAAAENRSDFQELAGQAAEHVKRKSAEAAKVVSDKSSEFFDNAKQQAMRFERENDLTGKAKDAFRSANEKAEELGDNLKRGTARMNSEYKVSEKFKQAAETFGSQAQAVDEKLGVKARLREIGADLRLNMPKYQRQVRGFMATPFGQFLTFSFFAWLVISGWLFRIFFWSIWLFPLLPLVLQGLAKQTMIQGACPACGLPYAGSKTAVLVCRRCRGVVWQPGQSMQNFNKNDPNIIDIDIN